MNCSILTRQEAAQIGPWRWPGILAIGVSAEGVAIEILMGLLWTPRKNNARQAMEASP